MREVWSHITVPSFQSDYMMSNQSAQTFTDPAFQNKMPLFDGSVTSPGLPKPQNMSGFFSKQPIQYSGAYFAYDPRGADTTAFSPPWSSCKSSLLDCRSPVNSLSGLKGRNHIIYRQDNMLSSEKSHSPSVHHIPLKQGFTCYTRSPGISRPTSPTSVTVKQKNGGGTSPSENSVYLAIPKPIYGQNPYCNELGCVVGQQYSVGHGSQRIPNPAYEREWVLTDSHCSERLSTERNTHNLLLQQRGLKVQPTAEPFKRETVETYSSLSPGRRMSLPAVMEPNYNSYPCTQVRTLLGPLSEQSQHLQSSPRGYHSLYSSHPTHERMTSEVFQECSVSKYGQLTKHPMFYYPQTNVELENSRRTKDSHGKQRDDVPVILQHAVSSPRDHYVIPQSIHDEIPLPSAQSLPNHSFVQHFDYPCYAVPRVHLNGSPVRVPVKRQHAPLSGINISPTSQCMDHLLVSSANLHNDKPNTSLHTSPPFLHVDQPSSSRHIGQPEFSPVGIQIGKLLSPTTSMHIDQLHSSPVSLNIDRHLDYSPCNGQLAYLKTPRGFVISPGAQLPQSPNRNSAQDQTPLASGSNLQKKMYSPTVAKGSEHNGSATVNPTGTLRKHLLDSSPCSNIKEETKDLCQVGPIKKRPKMEKEENKNDSPPMPVIDVVFSLAPYKSYLQKARALSPAKESQRTVHSPEVHEVETKSYIKEKSPASEEQLPVVCAQTLAEKSDEALEPKCIKLEKGDPDGNKSARKIKEEDYNETSVKMEKQEDGSPNNITLFVINKCKPEELECQPPCAGENNTSDHSAQREVTKDMETFSEGNTCTERTRVAVPDPKSILPPEPPQNKINFKNIPLQCLKLSTYKMILPDTKQSSKPVSVIEKSLGMPASANTPHLEHQMPVRKHFFELHHSLCKLVSRSVSVSSQEDLRTWLFHLELVETPSHNVQKLSCLLGVKAREVWLNEEIKSALHEVVERLMEYISVEYCPFPHVIRSGAVFIPMLVLKELLFPSVQGSFIDKVLQEHKVVLRPTTLSEEKLLIQLHKRSCSSKLRRLMSLKYLPNVYMDVVNLYYHACVCRHLGIDLDESSNRDTGEGCEENKSCKSLVLPPSPASESDSHVKAQHSKSQKPKSRITSSSRRLFLNDSMTEEEDAGSTHQETGGNQDVAVQEVSSISSILSLQKPTPEDSWTCPLSADELSSSPGHMETDNVSIPCPLSQSSLSVTNKNCPGVILKLKRLCGRGVNRKTSYQAVSQSGINTDSPEREITGRDMSSGTKRDFNRQGKISHRQRRLGSFTSALRPLSSSSNRKHRSLLKIKYCPYLSACHSTEHRRRWVLRSAVQKAQRAMRLSYPDLVGKRICHLYEEDDKSEVWYRGEVLSIHEAHANPLKTVFEVRYDSEPEWKYYLELLMDYHKGWLKIEE